MESSMCGTEELKETWEKADARIRPRSLAKSGPVQNLISSNEGFNVLIFHEEFLSLGLALELPP